MKLYKLAAVLSFLYMLGVAGNSDASLACIGIKLLIGTAVFAYSSWKGGLLK